MYDFVLFFFVGFTIFILIFDTVLRIRRKRDKMREDKRKGN